MKERVFLNNYSDVLVENYWRMYFLNATNDGTNQGKCKQLYQNYIFSNFILKSSARLIPFFHSQNVKELVFLNNYSDVLVENYSRMYFLNATNNGTNQGKCKQLYQNYIFSNFILKSSARLVRPIIHACTHHWASDAGFYRPFYNQLAQAFFKII